MSVVRAEVLRLTIRLDGSKLADSYEIWSQLTALDVVVTDTYNKTSTVIAEGYDDCLEKIRLVPGVAKVEARPIELADIHPITKKSSASSSPRFAA